VPSPALSADSVHPPPRDYLVEAERGEDMVGSATVTLGSKQAAVVTVILRAVPPHDGRT
jgi:hypothetical protein